ncbi:M23 family metallopeptidase [Streptomyces sp. RB6PN25]|uniref:M23 family metallopeptidase n=1 Tax=Streptomyces humicola TaxID=2953240 RepID=A0ABT1PYQ8_9ACTN|nr:M23 family metallopeptidase [Streptomyces humicola]MCQ4082811.1 M23 family metallopeptidase [Streptomyces humicola]
MNGRIRILGVAATAITLLLGAAPASTAATGDQLTAVPQQAAGSGLWLAPTEDAYRVSLPYGVSGGWMSGHHTGIDLAVPSGTPVYSVGSGTVVFAGYSGDYGNAVTIHMRDGYYTLYAHLSRIRVRRGQRVTADTRIGYSGATGRASGPHLHFEVRARRGYGSDVNPVSYLARHGVDLLD